VIHRAGLQAPQGYQSASQLALAGGNDWLNTLPREEREEAALVGPGRFKVSTDEGAVEMAADHFVLVDGALVLRSPQGNDLSLWAAGAWSRVELVG
jgi:hypothetical protein